MRIELKQILINRVKHERRTSIKFEKFNEQVKGNCIFCAAGYKTYET